MELYEKSAFELSEMLKAKECSAAEITASVFGRIDKTEASVEAYVTVCEESAREQAKKVDEMIAEGK